MNLQERNARIRALFDECAALLDRKGQDYAPNGGAFDNFSAIAELSGQGREQVLWVLLSKHLVTIRAGTSKTEPMRQRILDAIAYLAILEAMLGEPVEAKIGTAWTDLVHRDKNGSGETWCRLSYESSESFLSTNDSRRTTCKECLDRWQRGQTSIRFV